MLHQGIPLVASTTPMLTTSVCTQYYTLEVILVTLTSQKGEVRVLGTGRVLRSHVVFTVRRVLDLSDRILIERSLSDIT